MSEEQTACELSSKKCVPCEGGVPKYSLEDAKSQISALEGWQLTHDGTRIRRDWKTTNFRDGIKLMNNIGALAEREQHHPDLHIENYRHIWVELYTHAIGGLSENDFILAAKIDQIAPPQ